MLSFAVTSCVSQARNQRVLFVPLKLESGPRSPETLAPYIYVADGEVGFFLKKSTSLMVT